MSAFGKGWAFALALAIAQVAVAGGPPPSDADAQANAAKAELQAERFRSKAVREADVQWYVQQLRRDAAEAKAQAEAYEATASMNRRVIAGQSDDLDVRHRLFAAQAVYNALIFVMVTAVVAAGVWFSYLQFTVERRSIVALRAMMKELKALAPDDPARAALVTRLSAAESQAASSFEAGPMKITSNVIGLMVLAISLAFFYLYLDNVYKLQMEGNGLAAKAIQGAASAPK